MSTNLKDLLSIGTVIKLKKTNKRFMIFGVKQIDINSGKKFDYVGVPYPEGYIENGQILFQQDDIERIDFLGFNDIERQILFGILSEDKANNENPEKY